MSTLEQQLHAGDLRARARWRLVGRMLLGCLLVVAAVASTVATGTLLEVKINHVIDINFAGFKALVDYLGCVYVQVDRRYYHSNDGLGVGQTYDEINIQPGYQKLCGNDALHYVRYRHTDTDLVRAARQQDFLRQIKNQVGAGGLVARRYAIEKIFGKY